MKVRVLGIQAQDYVSRRTGNQVRGLSLHCAHPDSRVTGEAVDSIFISANLPCYHKLITVSPGWIANIEFDQRGSVVDADLLEVDPAARVSGPSDSSGAKK